MNKKPEKVLDTPESRKLWGIDKNVNTKDTELKENILNDICEAIYLAYGSGTGVLFGIPSCLKSSVRTIVELVLEKGKEAGRREVLEEVDKIINDATKVFISEESSKEELIDVIDNLLGFFYEIKEVIK